MNTISNKIYCTFFFIVYSSFITAQVWPIHQNDDTQHWNRISGTFGEIHPTGTDHFHGAIDIDITTSNCPFYPIESGIVVDDVGSFMDLDHEFPLNSGNFDRTTRYGHTSPFSFPNNPPVLVNNQLGTIENNASGAGDHLHLEFWQFIRLVYK